MLDSAVGIKRSADDVLSPPLRPARIEVCSLVDTGSILSHARDRMRFDATGTRALQQINQQLA